MPAAEKERDGEIGKAEAERENGCTLSGNVTAIHGENEAKISVAESDAVRREQKPKL